MQYTIENEELSVTIDSFGAEIISVISKKSNIECIWQADPDIWPRHAPILFPYTSMLSNGEFVAKGKTYKGNSHGFARDVEHKMIQRESKELTFSLCADEKTLSIFPYDFVLTSTFRLCGNKLNHSITVSNPGKEELSFGFGYHPGFICPFDKDHDTTDYEFRFDTKESPLVLECSPKGLTHQWNYPFGKNLNTIPLTDQLFSKDSFCMVNLKSSTLGIYEKESNRNITCNISGFPYVLIWSKNTPKIYFVCIEPWHSLPTEEDGSAKWEEKAAAAVLSPHEEFHTNLEMTFNL